MRHLAALLPLALVAGFALPAYAGTISIEGRGEVTAAPDTAFITSGVTTQGATAREALDLNTKAMAELITELKASGIEARDIQTSGFSVSPNYVYSDERDTNGYTLPPRIAGYQVANVVTVKVRALDQLGAILDKSVTIGANTINGVSFSVEDPSELLDEARKAAFADARTKAELYATAAGGSLEEIVSINESQNFSGPQPFEARSMAAAAPQKDVPVEAGELSFAINVSVQWELDTDK
ncbi:MULTISPECIES: SIMPL domain-containing protein [unclassified Devosia]|uniref:SIMPL domain-containing protein n=1 Tax=unclassified Devosia TaxID=196773 RepID=UPI00155542B0|nr:MULTISPECIES: SIMPL domain-containing protein [unclassified Devosia]